jgi:hypothetical protein
MMDPRHRPRVFFNVVLAAALLALPALARAEDADGSASKEEPNSQDDFWSRFKNVKAGPLTFDFAGQARLRHEYDGGFSVKGYAPGTHDQLLLERLRPELAITFWNRPKLFLQLQDAHVFLTRLTEADFPVLNGGATFAAQLGSYGRDTLRAFGANGNLGVTVPVAWKPWLRGQITWGSGDADPHDGVHGTFDGVYGGRDIYFYGYFNLFFWANLWDKELDFSVQPFQNVTAFLEYHHFNLAEARDAWYTTGLQPFRRDETGSSPTTLGDELDLRVVWRLWKHLELMAGYGRFFPGGFVRATGSSAPANWYFSQAAYSW